MNISMPAFFGAGLFDSRQKFGNKLTSEPRSVSCYELEYFVVDGGTAYINDTAHPIRKGYVLLGKPGDVRYSRFPFTCHFIHFALAPELQPFADALPSYFPCTDEQEVERFFVSIGELFCSPDVADTIIAASQLLVLLHLLRKSPPSHDQNHHILANATRFIEVHYTDEVKVADLAKHCGVSAPYLYRLYTKYLGCSPHEALLKKRLTAAKQALVSSDLTLNEIALTCGFGSQSYFSDCFKRQVGCTPNHFRKTFEYTP
ncbi:MAG: helix-turn-helix transcriptional regulator [Clostridia bacterium]|nr:helix-turn-helix transcriptional regulator [Clostridia bacterium]